MVATRRGPTVGRWLSSAALGAALCVGLPGVGRAQQAYQPYLTVERTESGFTVEAEDATLPQVLTALGQKAGFTVQDSGPVRTAMPLFEVHNASLDNTLKKLLGSENHLIVYRGDKQGQVADGSIEKIILLSPVVRTQTASKGNTPSSLAGPGTGGPATGRPPRDMPSSRRRSGEGPPPDDEPERSRLPPGVDPRGEQQPPPPPGENPAEELARERLEQLAVEGREMMAGSGVPQTPPAVPPGVMEQLEANGYVWDGEQAIRPEQQPVR